MKKISTIILYIFISIIIIIYFIYNINVRSDNKKHNIYNPKEKEKIISTDLRIGIINFDTINPIISNNSNVQNISRLIYEPLINLSYDYKLEKCLAIEWKKTDKRTYLIKLREHVKWQDGKNFDSDDVIFTINILKKLKEKSIYYYNVKNIKSVIKIDDFTIKIITDNEIPYFEYNLIFPIISSKYFTEENFEKENKNINPVGTGIYYIEDNSPDNLTLKINEYYWRENDYKIDNITLRLYDDVNNALEDNIDLIMSRTIDTENQIDNSKYIIKTYIGRNYKYIVLNLDSKYLKKKLLREAIKYAINKEEIIEKINNNNYIKSEFPLDFGSFLYNKSKEESEYNIEKANKILEENKIKNVKLRLIINKGNEYKIKLANIIKQQLSKLNIEVNIIERDEKEYKKDLKNKNYDLLIVENTYSFSPSLESYFENGNLANYYNEKILNLIKNLETNTEEENKKIIEKLIEYYNKDIPYISLFYDTNTIIYSKNLKGEIKPNSYNIFYNIENWYREYDK